MTTNLIISVNSRLLATAPISHPSSFSYPIQLDDDAWLAIPVSVGMVIDSRAVLQDGAVELTGALRVVLHITTVLLQEVLVWGALVIFLGLDGVVVGWKGGQQGFGVLFCKGL